ncbi:MAG: flagellar basal body P-ring protein FlgI [Phycisphaerae bacterium]|jgi:hypothetical protein
MKAGLPKIIIYFLVTAVPVCFSGCDESKKETATSRSEMQSSAEEIKSGTKIGDIADVYMPDYILVQSYSIVGELAGTGSADCPPRIRDYLKGYILRYLPSTDIDKLINGVDTSVVIVEGLVPTTGKGAMFDVRVAVPGGAQTSSLEHGQLYGAELRQAGSFGLSTKLLAVAQGPVYIDKIDPVVDETVGYILGGGYVLDDYKMIITLKKPDYFAASAIRNRIIERFGEKSANAISASQVELKIPRKYARRKNHFIAVLKATYLNLTKQDKEQVIADLISQLSGSGNRDAAEISLESLGRDAVGELRKLLDSDDYDTCFRAARTLLVLDSDAGLNILRAAAFDSTSPRRTEAIEAISSYAERGDAVALCRRLLSDEDVNIMLAAYEQLLRMNDISVSEELVGRNFVLESVPLGGTKLIYVTRSGRPRIAIFGGPINCNNNLFVQSADGNITLNSPAGDSSVTVIRRIPGKEVLGPVSLKTSGDLSDIIRLLGNEPKKVNPNEEIGFGAGYSEIIALLDEMVKKSAVDAQFIAGPKPQISLK